MEKRSENYRDTEGNSMELEPMDLIRDKFSQERSIETVLHLLMVHFNMSEEEAQAEIDEYFKIVDWMDKHRDCGKVQSSPDPLR